MVEEIWTQAAFSSPNYGLFLKLHKNFGISDLQAKSID